MIGGSLLIEEVLLIWPLPSVSISFCALVLPGTGFTSTSFSLVAVFLFENGFLWDLRDEEIDSFTFNLDFQFLDHT